MNFLSLKPIINSKNMNKVICQTEKNITGLHYAIRSAILDFVPFTFYDTFRHLIEFLEILKTYKSKSAIYRAAILDFLILSEIPWFAYVDPVRNEFRILKTPIYKFLCFLLEVNILASFCYISTGLRAFWYIWAKNYFQAILNNILLFY